ncbi:Putative trans-acting enoyl reductase [Planctomycetes bacterium Poly30]|uniref:Trans-acting enoyl reductase n=1 Tax=Saltatorellus ferox TaxID=2528018 RepID=A0A518EMP4_9BACT|nr:Putative trans-acting enoyl reductase [Planctomycetes bacterium Poly30]
MNRDFDIVLLGATGFAGGHAAERLAKVAPDGLSWAVAGRRADALAALSKRLGCGHVVADVEDTESLTALARSTRVLLTTAGPFAKLGGPVADACVAERTHYADLTGEVPFMRGLIDRHHARAKAEGTTLLPASGFDSVPAELAAFTAMEEARRRGVRLASLRTVYRLRGGLNGGTLASAIDIMENGDRRLLADPYSLVPNASASGPERRALADPTRPVFDETGGRYVAPFFMGAINRRVVRRMIELARAGESPAIEGDLIDGLGDTFRYDEYQSVSKGRGWLAAWTTTALLGAGVGLLSTGVGRRLARRFGPSPGEGPSEETLRKGLTRMTTTAFLEGGGTFVIEQDMQGDPGNAATVRILVEVGLALAAGEAQGGGVLTPVSALGARLRERLGSTGQHSVTVDQRPAPG